jgi:hypothetical protein
MRNPRGSVALALALTLGLAYADVPETYQVIVQRNLFSPSRGSASARLSATATAVAAPTVTDTITLVGVAVLEGQATALFAGSAPGLSGARRKGDTLDTLRLSSVSTAGVRVDTGNPQETLQLAVGQSLSRLAGQSWRVSAAPLPVPTTASDSAATAAPATSAGDADDILKRMRERRQKEMNP